VNDSIESMKLWDDAIATDLPGKVLLIGLTFKSTAGVAERQEQFWGRVIAADQRAGISLVLLGSRDGESFDLPPDTRSIRVARRGDYQLRSTGEIVTDPDYTVTFLVQESDG
jgi:hypothetical protein